MATVSFIPESHQSISAMKAVIEYCLQQKKVADEDSGRRLVSGVNCNGENAFTEFMATKTAHHKKGGMNFYHYVQSFSPNENIFADGKCDRRAGARNRFGVCGKIVAGA